MERPNITCPAPFISTRTDPQQATSHVTFMALSEDNSGNVSVLCDPPSGTNFSIPAVNVICTAADPSGNMKTCHFVILVNGKCLKSPNLRSKVEASSSYILFIHQHVALLCMCISVWMTPDIQMNCRFILSQKINRWERYGLGRQIIKYLFSGKHVHTGDHFCYLCCFCMYGLAFDLPPSYHAKGEWAYNPPAEHKRPFTNETISNSSYC